MSQRCGGFLRVLSLRHCRSVEDDALITFAHNCPNIEQLVLRKCVRITDRFVLLIFSDVLQHVTQSCHISSVKCFIAITSLSSCYKLHKRLHHYISYFSTPAVVTLTLSLMAVKDT